MTGWANAETETTADMLKRLDEEAKSNKGGYFDLNGLGIVTVEGEEREIEDLRLVCPYCHRDTFYDGRKSEGDRIEGYYHLTDPADPCWQTAALVDSPGSRDDRRGGPLLRDPSGERCRRSRRPR